MNLCNNLHSNSYNLVVQTFKLHLRQLDGTGVPELQCVL